MSVVSRLAAIGLLVALAAALSGCYSPGPVPAGSVLEVQNDTALSVHVSWPIGAPVGAEHGAFDVPANGTATYRFDGLIDAAFVVGGRTVEQKITSPVPGTTVHVRVSTAGTVEIILTATPTP
ncbi:MAG: hypothetical protein ACRDGL_08635 [Candidatus Limnocylindrales bacterium]